MCSGQFVLQALFRRETPVGQPSRLSICMLISGLFSASPAHPLWATMTSAAFAHFVATGHVYVRSTGFVVNDWTLLLALDALRAGYLEIDRDAEGLAGFFELVQSDETPEELVVSFMRCIGREFPELLEELRRRSALADTVAPP